MSGMSEISVLQNQPSGKCADPECGHVAAAHGTNGYICCVGNCKCKKFKTPEEIIQILIDLEIAKTQAIRKRA